MNDDLAWLTARPIAHRGLHDGNRKCWENTLSAFQAAIDGNYAIELDVQLSADGHAMVFHDATLERLTDETGPLSVRDAEALIQLHVGGTEDRIPTLAKTLQLIASQVPVVIEMKDNGDDNKRLAKAVCDDLAVYDGPAAVMSFAQDLVADFVVLKTRWPLGLTAEGIGQKALARHEDALELGISFVSYHVKALPNPFVQKVRAMGMPVISWTVRTPADIAATRNYADQMTFEGFDPDALN